MKFRCIHHCVREQVFAITVGLEEPAPTPEDVDAFVKREAQLNGYRADARKWIGLALHEREMEHANFGRDGAGIENE